MGLTHSPIGPSDGLILCLDTANRRSYPGSGTNWFDLSGNENHGTLIGPTYQISGGKYALDFDNSDDYVLLPTNLVVDQASRLSLSWWENITSNTGTYASRFILKTNGTRGLIVFRSTATGYTTLSVNGKNSGNYTNFPTAPSIASSVGIWRHWVLVNPVSVGAAGDNWRLFVDGIEYVYGGLGNAATAFGNPTSRIGLDGLGDDPTNARLDDIRIYSRALAPAEIRQLFEIKRRRYL